MRKVIVEVEMSLDGYIGGQEPGFWQQVFPFHTDEVTKYLDDTLLEADALLMGDKTFQFFAEVWPQRDGEQAEKMNSMTKYVASRELKEPLEWHGSLLKGDVAEEIEKLKQQPGKPLLQYGVGELTHTMLDHGLVDEIRILIYPFTYDEGPRIFEHMGINTMELLQTKTFDCGAVALWYRPQKAEQ